MKDIAALLEEKKVISLDMGGALAPQKGFIVMDERDLPTVDIIHNYDDYPFPFPDESLSFIKCVNVIEKINRANKGMITFMNECWRVLKPEAQMTIATWYGGSYEYNRDPRAVNPLNEGTFAFFDPLDPLSHGQWFRLYQPKPWKIITQLWNTIGLMEVLLERRREDPSYYPKVEK